MNLWHELGRGRRWAVTGLSLLLALVLLRLCLAFVIKTGANQVLQHMDRYSGHIDDVTVTLWRGAYQFHGVNIATRDGKVPVPLFTAESLAVSLQWMALLRGKLVAKVVLQEPVINFVAGPAKDQTQTGKEQNWAEVMQALVPVKIDRLEIHQGQVHVVDPYRQPPWDIHLKAVEATVEGLRSRRGEGVAEAGLPCAISMTANLMDDGRLDLQLRFDAFADKATFDYELILLKLQLNKMNPVLAQYVGVDVAAGELSVYSEGKAEAGQFQGYLKPMVKGLRVLKLRDALSPMVVKKSLVGLVAWIFKDHFRDMDATKIRLSGDLSKSLNVGPAFMGLLKNAFFSHQLPQLDQEPDLHEFQ
jgi:hypothetical protein